jgi:putative Mg2+ transporter-C (MgtC) family protein
VIDWSEILLRLGIATLAGAAIGLNRDLHGKPIGLRTLAIVCLASAMVVTIADLSDDVAKLSDATSRVIQGILTGIGFLGAGVIMRTEAHTRVRGLTSAACTFLTACVGIVCGAGQWRVIGIGLARVHHPHHRRPAGTRAASSAWRQGSSAGESHTFGRNLATAAMKGVA